MFCVFVFTGQLLVVPGCLPRRADLSCLCIIFADPAMFCAWNLFTCTCKRRREKNKETVESPFVKGSADLCIMLVTFIRQNLKLFTLKCRYRNRGWFLGCIFLFLQSGHQKKIPHQSNIANLIFSHNHCSKQKTSKFCSHLIIQIGEKSSPKLNLGFFLLTNLTLVVSCYIYFLYSPSSEYLTYWWFSVFCSHVYF